MPKIRAQLVRRPARAPRRSPRPTGARVTGIAVDRLAARGRAAAHCAHPRRGGCRAPVATRSAGPIGQVASSDVPTTRNAGPMSIPNPVGMPGRQRDPERLAGHAAACGRRRGRTGMTFGAITPSRGRAAARPSPAAPRRASPGPMPLPRSTRAVGLAGLAGRRLARRFSVSFMAAQDDDGPSRGPHPALTAGLRLGGRRRYGDAAPDPAAPRPDPDRRSAARARTRTPSRISAGVRRA